MKVAGKTKNFPRKENAIFGGEKKGLLNSNLASNKILRANYQSIRVLSKHRSGQASSTCTRKAKSVADRGGSAGTKPYGTLE